jgi:CubicO group peptidase (beta-lactamase class C family)
MPEIRQWHDKTLQEHEGLRDAAAAKHFRFQSLSLYGTPSTPLYGAVMIKWDPYPAQRDYSLLDLADLRQKITDQKALKMGPAIITATGSAKAPAFAVVFATLVPGAVCKLTMGNGSASDSSTIQYEMATQKAAGLTLRWAASYGDAENPRFAAIWQPQSTDPVMWSADGALDSGDTYQQRFDAQVSAWARPYFVTLNKSQQFLSAFVADEAGGYWARHGMDSAGLTSEYTTWVTKKKFIPVCVQGAGEIAATASFAALFVENEKPTKRTFTATGPVANAQIDAVIETALRDSPLRDAALAIVHKKRLVYARGYTLAEPGWPITQPTTRFRLASNSKTVTALAAYQIIEQNHLSLDDHVQDILQLSTPSGGPPADSRFAAIKVRHLLEHTSGLDTDTFRNGVAVRDAFIAAGHPNTLPVSHSQTESYIASLAMVSAPGATAVYNNCANYLLGRVIRKKRSASDAISAYSHLFDPLHITRIRNATSLVANQPANEARYQTSQLSAWPSQLSDAQPLVPDEYGTEQIEMLEGCGGLSGAATDLARLIAILLSDVDNPAMKRQTIVDMLNKGVANESAYHSRAGYGWDSVSAQPGDRFYAQKGGSLDSDHSVIQIDGDWGFTMLWAGSSAAATGWYPDYPDVMDVAKAVAWSSSDLFPTFGMPSL